MDKIVKQVSLVLALTISLSGCSTNEELINRDNFIKAGQKDTEVLYQNFTPPAQIVLTNYVTDNFPTSSYSGELLLDLDLDGFDDIKFYSFYGVGHPKAFVTPSEGCKISDIGDDKIVEICNSPKQQNDLIDENLEWFNLSDFTNAHSDKALLSSYTPEWTETPEVKNNLWQEADQYLAYRIIQKSDTVYGWIGIQIDAYYKLAIKDTGLAK